MPGALLLISSRRFMCIARHLACELNKQMMSRISEHMKPTICSCTNVRRELLLSRDCLHRRSMIKQEYVMLDRGKEQLCIRGWNWRHVSYEFVCTRYGVPNRVAARRNGHNTAVHGCMSPVDVLLYVERGTNAWCTLFYDCLVAGSSICRTTTRFPLWFR